ncbi:helix-turn-helix domain-containing protein [Candidatus Omnitrophota bacterium]
MKEIDKIFLTIGRGKVYNKVIDDTEKMLIEEALKRSFGNQSIAAKLLGINRNTLHAKVRKLKIDPMKFKI